jgi:hypothetical protein
MTDEEMRKRNEKVTLQAELLDREKEQFLKLVYRVLAKNPQWVRDVVKAINAATKDQWIEAED